MPIIVFNNIELPRESVFIDICASSRIIKDISEEMSLWFWQFTICVGLTKTENSSIVIKYATELNKLIIKNRERILKKLIMLYGSENADSIINSWQRTLNIMIETAEQSETCTWSGQEIIVEE